MLLTMLMKASLTPNLLSDANSACGWILSNAFSQSSIMRYSGVPCLSAFSWSLLTIWTRCEHDLFDLKPNCEGLNLWSIAVSILVCISLATNLYAVASRLIGLYISGSAWLPFPLNISTTFARFYSVGVTPVVGISSNSSIIVFCCL